MAHISCSIPNFVFTNLFTMFLWVHFHSTYELILFYYSVHEVWSTDDSWRLIPRRKIFSNFWTGVCSACFLGARERICKNYSYGMLYLFFSGLSWDGLRWSELGWFDIADGFGLQAFPLRDKVFFAIETKWLQFWRSQHWAPKIFVAGSLYRDVTNLHAYSLGDLSFPKPHSHYHSHFLFVLSILDYSKQGKDMREW